ncbi:hypothetical protein GGI21_006205, partial [Coemansia aciculifera]
GDLAACATFSGSLGLVASNSLDPVAAWKVPVEYAGAGVTELRWSGDHVLWAAQRRSRWLVAWDIRDLRSPVVAVPRVADTMQRLAMDTDAAGRYLVSGGLEKEGEEEGVLTFYDTANDGVVVDRFKAADDVVAAIAAHPYYPLLATA